jgi:hypothetical protein
LFEKPWFFKKLKPIHTLVSPKDKNRAIAKSTERTAHYQTETENAKRAIKENS